MFLNFGHQRELSVEALLARREESLILDLRGGEDYEPAIPGSRQVYILKIFDQGKEFQERFDETLRSRPLLLYCGHGGGSALAVKKFKRKYRAQSLKGGMVGYLEFITQLLGNHPYENPETREETIRRLLLALTDRHTPFRTFRAIADRLLRASPDPRIRRQVSPGF
ncbi:MAG: rhodanese-like domain-containing protein [Magnetococcales bacterium]|nr:rhodanese-like domain-containing protein [Magnetococcales bacterium]MBF0156439.1 rhodanese-like domain-containing protein [Magnetococcales bacterium]